MATKNDDLLSKVSQGGPYTNTDDAYAQEHGRYDDSRVNSAMSKRPSVRDPGTVNPFGPMGGGK